MRSVVVGVLLVIATPLLGFQGRPGGQGAGRGAPIQGPNAIVGRVSNSAGQPIAGVFVTALRPATGDRPFSFVSALLHVLTDAKGEYRLDGLSVGDYFIVALPQNAPGTPQQLARTGYGRTFFPNAADVTSAGNVHVTGFVPARADLTLVPARLAVISGVVIKSDGQPARNGVLQMSHGDHLFGFDAHAYQLSAAGTFAIPAVPPGTYFLVFHESQWPPARGETPVISQTRVVVNGTDAASVRVGPIHMVEASGRLVMDAASRASVDPATLTIGSTPVDFDGNPGPQRSGTAAQDLTFTFAAWPGAGRVRVFPENLWSIKSIRLNGADVTNAPITFIEGKPVTGLEVEIVRRTTGRGRLAVTK